MNILNKQLTEGNRSKRLSETIEQYIGGHYIMSDGYSFWINKPVAVAIASRIMKSIFEDSQCVDGTPLENDLPVRIANLFMEWNWFEFINQYGQD